MNNLKIIFIATPQFGAIILQGLVKNTYKPVLVISSPDKPAGRKQALTPSPVKLTAQEHNLPLLQKEKIKEEDIKNLKPDLIISAASSMILPKNILEIPRYGSLNVHPSLLPKYRGASPIQAAILNGDKETGISIVLMAEKIDQGDIISSTTYPLSNKENSENLTEKLAELSISLLIKTISQWIEGKIKLKAQKGKPSYTKTLKKKDGKINWQKSAEDIERQIRAFYPWPGSFTLWKKNKLLRVKILEAEISQSKEKHSIGQVFLQRDDLCVQCKEGILIIKKLQLEGKKPMSSEDFLRGNKEFINTTLQ